MLNRTRRWLPVAALVVLVPTLAGCTTNSGGSTADLTTGSRPTTTDLAAPARQDDPGVQRLPAAPKEHDCPGGSATRQEARSKMRLVDASREIAKTGARNSDRYTGVAVCPRTGTATVYRLGDSASLDTEMRSIAKKHRITLRLVDSTHPLAFLRRTEDSVVAQSEELKRRGAELYTVQIRLEGFVEAGVAKNLPAARRTLSEYGEAVKVVRGYRIVPR